MSLSCNRDSNLHYLVADGLIYIPRLSAGGIILIGAILLLNKDKGHTSHDWGSDLTQYCSSRLYEELKLTVVKQY